MYIIAMNKKNKAIYFSTKRRINIMEFVWKLIKAIIRFIIRMIAKGKIKLK